MFHYRITKYDPAHRNQMGHYIRDDWISITDIGRTFNGVVLTCEKYQEVEDAYVLSAFEFLVESHISSLVVVGLENHNQCNLSFAEGSSISIEDVARVLRQLLRGEFWCRLESNEGYVHIGHDYYMYVGVSSECPNATIRATQRGLFVEPIESPYRVAE